MRYCGVVPVGPAHLQLVVVEELRDPDPPIRLVGELLRARLGGRGGRPAAAVGGRGRGGAGRPADPDAGERSCDAMLADLGVAPARPSPELAALAGRLGGLARFAVRGGGRRVRWATAPTPRPPDRDQRRRRLLRPAEPAAAGPPPPARHPDAHRGARGRAGRSTTAATWGTGASRSSRPPRLRCARTATRSATPRGWAGRDGVHRAARHGAAGALRDPRRGAAGRAAPAGRLLGLDRLLQPRVQVARLEAQLAARLVVAGPVGHAVGGA